MATKARIYPGDAHAVVYECRKLNPDNLGDRYGMPDVPTQATVKVLDKQSGEFIVLAGLSTTEIPAEIVPPTGSNDGGLVRFIFGPPYTDVSGDYTILIRAWFDDGVILTEDRVVKVLEYR